MNHYKKSPKYRERLEVCLPGLEDSTSSLVVTPGTQIYSVLPSALDSLKRDGQVLWIGWGSASDKAVACAEAMKSKYKGLNQVTQILTKRVEEFWDPTIEGMNTLQVTREIPAIVILLSIPKDKKKHSDRNEEEIYGERIFCDGFEV